MFMYLELVSVYERNCVLFVHCFIFYNVAAIPDKTDAINLCPIPLTCASILLSRFLVRLYCKFFDSM